MEGGNRGLLPRDRKNRYSLATPQGLPDRPPLTPGLGSNGAVASPSFHPNHPAAQGAGSIPTPPEEPAHEPEGYV